MKKLFLIAMLMISFNQLVSKEHAYTDDRLYIDSKDIQLVGGKPVITRLYVLGITANVYKDSKGYFLYLDEGECKQKCHRHYHYCRRCDQEFFTDKSYYNHKCKRGYYQRYDDGDGRRICDFNRESEFNRPSEF